jgi:hypothetical protein
MRCLAPDGGDPMQHDGTLNAIYTLDLEGGPEWTWDLKLVREP